VGPRSGRCEEDKNSCLCRKSNHEHRSRTVITMLAELPKVTVSWLVVCLFIRKAAGPFLDTDAGCHGFHQSLGEGARKILYLNTGHDPSFPHYSQFVVQRYMNLCSGERVVK
jgi:hypothetical protein